MSSALVNPLQFPEEWDHVRVGNVVSPGYCTWSGWTRVNEFDVKKGKGTKGATITFVQLPPVEGEFTFYLWDDGRGLSGHNHFAEWDAFLPLLKYDPSKKQIEAISLYHPALADLDITSVLCTEIGPIERDDKLMFSVKCKFLEYWPPPKGSAVGTAKKSKTPKNAASGNAEPTAPSKEEKEISDLWNKFNSDAPVNEKKAFLTGEV